MRIETSSIAMTSARSFQEEALVQQATIRRHYNEDGREDHKSITETTLKTTRTEQEAGTSLYASSSSGALPAEQTEAGQNTARTQASRPRQADQSSRGAGPNLSGSILRPAETGDWLSGVLDSVNSDPKIQLLRKCLELLERITGRECSIDLKLGDRSQARGETVRVSASSVSLRYAQMAAGLDAVPLPQRAQGANPNGFWTRETVSSGVRKGTELTRFSSTGTVVTSDGRTIDFGVHMEMSRSFETAFASATKEEVYTDPLVINLDTDAASLSDVTFLFDLNCDGKAEELSALGRGSGFLALDRNGDGVINDGSELFGARTGDGFGELAQYDLDGNGWIDENDEVFSRLSVWTKCGSGEAKQLSLAEAGVGAIFLGSQSTQFTLTDAWGEEGAMVRRTGLYLREDGRAGTVQHLDFKA